jgi:large subunit ribosomal protein L7Ae
MVQAEGELATKIYGLVEAVKVDGKLRKGANEATKSIERNEAKLVIIASDVNPPEVIMHLPILCKEKDISFVHVPAKNELGAAAGLPVGTAAVAVALAGDAKRKFDDVLNDLKALDKAPKVEIPKPLLEKAAPKEDKPKKEEPKVEEKPEAPVEEPKPVEEKKEEKPKAKPKKAPKEEKVEEEIKEEAPAKELKVEEAPKEEVPIEVKEEPKEEAPAEEKPAEEEKKEEPKAEEEKPKE